MDEELEDLIEKIVEEIISVFRDWRPLNHGWNSITDDAKERIKQALREIIIAELSQNGMHGISELLNKDKTIKDSIEIEESYGIR